MTDILLPNLGDFKDVEVIEIHAAPGLAVEIESPLITVETDKASLEVPSPINGVIKAVTVKCGDKINSGDVIATASVNSGKSPAATEEDGDQEPAAKKQKPPAAAGETVTVKLPDIGDFDQVEVIEVMTKAGDKIEVGSNLITLESDKASMDVPSTHAGTVQKVMVKVGEKISKGADIVTVLAEKTTDSAAPAATGTPPDNRAPAREKAPPDQQKPVPSAPAAPASKPAAARDPALQKPHASPSVRKLAREFGANLAMLRGSGPKGRILKEDVRLHINKRMQDGGGTSGLSGIGYELPAPAENDFSEFGQIETEKLPRIKQISGPALHRNWLHIPHVTQSDEADVTELETFRKMKTSEAEKQGFRLSPLAFVVKACAVALNKFPKLNSSLAPDGKSLILKKYYHVGIAVDTAAGLVVPVVREVNAKTVSQIAREMGEISLKAREGKLGPREMRGGTFTISSLGGIGGTGFTPIINHPEAAILGVSRSRIKPVWNGKEFQPRLLMPLSLSYDHRIIDGAEGARFITFLSSLLADIRNVLL